MRPALPGVSYGRVPLEVLGPELEGVEEECGRERQDVDAERSRPPTAAPYKVSAITYNDVSRILPTQPSGTLAEIAQLVERFFWSPTMFVAPAHSCLLEFLRMSS